MEQSAVAGASQPSAVEHSASKPQSRKSGPKNPIIKAYAILYNLIQAAGWTYVLVLLAQDVCALGFQAASRITYIQTAPVIRFLQTLAYLEIFHAMTGIVVSDLIPTIMQVLGRNQILFIILGNVKQLQSDSMVFYLFLAWAAIEAVRYPFYALTLADVCPSWVKWLRYTLWIPLYPVGFVTEAYLLYFGIPFFESTGLYSIQMPNIVNMSFDFALWLKIVLSSYAVLPIYMYLHMWNQRKRKLSPSASASSSVQKKRD